MLLIKNGHILDPLSGASYVGNIYVEGDRIIKVEEGAPSIECDKVIDASNLTVVPGLIDVHSHFRDPGYTYKEDIYTGALSAAAGGYTTVVLMCNTNPTVDNVETLKYVIDRGLETEINVLSCGSVTYGLKGKELTDFDALYEAGAVGFTDDGIPLMDADLLKAAMEKAAKMKLPISLHEEDKNLIDNNGINRGKASEYYNCGGSPREAEITLVARDVEIAKQTGAILDVQHISTKEVADLLRKVKADGYTNIHGEGTPHHFSLTEDDVIKKGTLAKVNPPIRTEEDRQAVIEAIRDGVIDIIATDHAPHSEEEKNKSILNAPSGMIGLETALALSITKLVKESGVDIMTVIKALTINPANMYGFKEVGAIKEGYKADICIFDENEEWVVDKFASRSKNSPFIGEKLTGKVKYTICSGNIVYKG